MFLPREIFGSLLLRGSLLAQTDTAVPELTPFQQFLSNPMWLACGALVFFYLIVMMPEKRRKADEAAKLSGIKKNDRIVTIGGIHGVVASIGDADTITIRLDENGTARMKIDRKAVSRILADVPAVADTKD